MNNASLALADWLKKIEKEHPCSIELGLDRVTEVGNKASLLNFNCPVIMIAGTNGKGSTQATLAELLDAAGKKYATYSSPHILHFNERIRINGKMVSDEQLCEAFAYIESLSCNVPLTYFEFTTLAAFYIFKHASLDVLLLEVGLGGRLDAVNAVSADIAVITSIGFDHEAYLGRTLEAIAKEKAGILRPNIPVILSEQACLSAVLERAKEYSNPLYIENKNFGFTDKQGLEWEFSELAIKLYNNFLPINSVSLAMATYTILGNELMALPSLSQCIQSIEEKGMVGRFHECALDNIVVIFDVAHNGAGANWLAKKLSMRPKVQKRYGVWASLADKSLEAIIEPMISQIDEWYVGGLVTTSRACSPKDLQSMLKKQGCRSVNVFSTVQEAFLAAKKQATTQDEVVVWGSFFTVADAYHAAKLQNVTQEKNGLFYR